MFDDDTIVNMDLQSCTIATFLTIIITYDNLQQNQSLYDYGRDTIEKSKTGDFSV